MKCARSGRPADKRALGHSRSRRGDGTEAQIAFAFTDAYRMLQNRISILCALPISGLDRLSAAKAAQRHRQVVSLARKLFAEALGSALLAGTVIGSGVLAQRLAGGNDAVALIGNTLATAAMLYVLVSALGPVSGAHFNPAVTLVMGLRGEIGIGAGLAYALMQVAGCVAARCWRMRCSRCRCCRYPRMCGRAGAGAVRRRGDVRAGVRDPGRVALAAEGRARRSGAGDRRRLLVDRLNLVRQPAITIARALSDTFAGVRPATSRLHRRPVGRRAGRAGGGRCAVSAGCGLSFSPL